MEEAPRDIVDIAADREAEARARIDAQLVLTVDTDRCFTCGSQAFVYAELPSGKSIALCGHHGTEAWDKLNREAVVVIDHRSHIGVD